MSAIAAPRAAVSDVRTAWHVPAVALLAVISAAILGARPAAAFPPGDGGLFYRVIVQLLENGFRFPHIVTYNGIAIPFSYSPLGFYGVAGLVAGLHLAIPQAMALWVIAWNAAFAPAAYYAARKVLVAPAEAIVATAMLVVFPVNAAWLGMGGAITRAPGFAFYLVACGASWAALRDGDRRTGVVAVLAGAAVAWFHMEFFFLYGITLIVFIVAQRRVRSGILVGAAVLALALPWFLLSHHDGGSFANALQTRHFDRTSIPLEDYLRYWGIGRSGDVLPLLAVVALVFAAFRGRAELLAWAFVVIALDTRAGVQVAHLPAALALGWAFGRVEHVLRRPADRSVAFAVAAVAFAFGAAEVAMQSAQFVRVTPADAAEWAHIGRITPPDAAVFTLSPRAVEEPGVDQTPEWLPAFSGRFSPITYQGLEWVNAREFGLRAAAYYDFEHRCVRDGAPCVREFVRRLSPNRPAYLFVPRHGDGYAVLIAAVGTDRRMHRIDENGNGALFEVTR